jgi:hypothetical protein
LLHHSANRKEFHPDMADGKKMDIIFQVSDDGVAFRYFFPETSTDIYSLKASPTTPPPPRPAFWPMRRRLEFFSEIRVDGLIIVNHQNAVDFGEG